VITTSQIYALAPDASSLIVEGMLPNFNAYAAKTYGINTHLRIAHFFGQIAVESHEFTKLEEDLVYTHADRIAAVWPRLASRASSLVRNPIGLANSAYADKYGNGDEESGDGFKFRGRGLIQNTFKSNYAALAERLNLPLVDKPEMLGQPDVAMLAAMEFWDSHRCNEAADLDDVRAVTFHVNGGENGLTDRETYTTRAKGIF
jgi:putative chitinase